MAGGRVADPRRGKAPKAEVVPEPSRYLYRSRPTLPGPFGEEPATEGTLAEVQARHAMDTDSRLAPVIEYRVPGVPWALWRKPVTVRDLAREGLAQEREGRWHVLPEGARRLREALLS